MIKNNLSEIITQKYGTELCKEGQSFPSNKISIIISQKKPIKIRSLVLDNEREFHILVDEEKRIFYHDCPRFLIYGDDDKKICAHIVKLLFMIEEEMSFKILNEIENYELTAEDLGSKRKGQNYMILANSCFEANNCVEGLSYLNKALVDQSQCQTIIEKYLKNAIKNSLFVEFFEFLRQGIKSDINPSYFHEHESLIEKGFKVFLKSISRYSVYGVLKIIEAISTLLSSIGASFVNRFLKTLVPMVKSNDFNEKYFSTYFLIKYKQYDAQLSDFFKDNASMNSFNMLKEKSLEYFLDQIDCFCAIEELKLMKKHFKVLGISREVYEKSYDNYKEELIKLEKKLYVKKFAYLMLLIEKHGIIRSLGGFKKKRNVYVVAHDDKNMKNPAYHYIINNIGFYGNKKQFIKSSDIGINLFLIKILFLDELDVLPDVLYYKNQFWGDINELEVNKTQGFSLFPRLEDRDSSISQRTYNNSEIMIIEWDIAIKPLMGSIINAYSTQIVIPDQKNPLFHDLKPFDLCYCKKTPERIDADIIKKINVVSKCSFKDAIYSVSNGMDFIARFYPLSLIRNVVQKKNNPFEAYQRIANNPDKSFIPNYNRFIIESRDFLFEFMKKEKEYIFQLLRKEPTKQARQYFFLLGLETELDGMDLPYSNIMQDLIEQDVSFEKFKSSLLKKIHSYIKVELEKGPIACTDAFNLNKMQYTSFARYSRAILSLRKEEFEKSRTYYKDDYYDISELLKTYYGKKFAKILKLGQNPSIRPVKFKKIEEYSNKLKLKLNIVV